MNARKLIIAFLLTVTIAGGAVLVRDSQFAISTPTVPPLQGSSSVARAAVFSDFELYNADASYAGLPLTAVDRVDAKPFPGELVRANFFTFIYGDCNPSRGGSTEGGCAPPLQIQIWPACERNPSVYSPDEIREPVKVRGVPGHFYDLGTRLELTTGAATVVIFGRSKSQLLDVARKLVPANGVATSLGVTRQTSLPKPKAGAVQGTLACSFG